MTFRRACIELVRHGGLTGFCKEFFVWLLSVWFFYNCGLKAWLIIPPVAFAIMFFAGAVYLVRTTAK